MIRSESKSKSKSESKYKSQVQVPAHLPCSTRFHGDEQGGAIWGSLSLLPSKRLGVNMYVLQRCTHPRFQCCEIHNIHAAQSDMTCVSPASLQHLLDIPDRSRMARDDMRFSRVVTAFRKAVLKCVSAASNAGECEVRTRRKQLPVSRTPASRPTDLPEHLPLCY